MSFDRLLALYHYCNQWHSGQWSREYALLSRITSSGFRPSRSEEYLSVLGKEGYEEAGQIYTRLVKAHQHQTGDISGGYVSCACCGMPTICDCILADNGIEMCSECIEAQCCPQEGCNIEDEDEESDEPPHPCKQGRP